MSSFFFTGVIRLAHFYYIKWMPYVVKPVPILSSCRPSSPVSECIELCVVDPEGDGDGVVRCRDSRLLSSNAWLAWSQVCREESIVNPIK